MVCIYITHNHTQTDIFRTCLRSAHIACNAFNIALQFIGAIITDNCCDNNSIQFSQILHVFV